MYTVDLRRFHNPYVLSVYMLFYCKKMKVYITALKDRLPCNTVSGKEIFIYQLPLKRTRGSGAQEGDCFFKNMPKWHMPLIKALSRVY